MSGSVPPTQLPQPPPPSGFMQSQASVLGPGIVGLFIQGIETGLVFAQFSQWFASLDRGESSVLSTVVIFVTVVGLAQSGISFGSVWRGYVQHFGEFLLPGWDAFIQPIPTLAISAPVQALMIRRCYYLVSKNLYIITPLVVLLVASIVMSLWSIVLICRFYTVVSVKDPLFLLQLGGISWPFLMSVLLPSVLDLTLTGILLRSLTGMMKRVYAARTRKRVSRLVNVVWQSALPPTLCAISVSVFYIHFTIAGQKQLGLWVPILQAIVGKLYVLSLFYMINAQPIQPDEQPTTFMSTLTGPTEVLYTLTRDGRGEEVTRGEITAGRGPARTVDFAV